MKRKLIAASLVIALAGLVVAVAQALGKPRSASGASATITIDIPPVLRTQPVVKVTLPKPTKVYQLGFVVPLLSEPGEGSVAAGTRKAAALAGAKMDVQDAMLDVNKQVQLADSMLSRGYSSVLTIDLFAHSMDPFYARADRKGVPTITEYSKRPGSVGEAWQTPGKEAAAIILKRYPRGATGVMLSDTPAPVILNRERGFRQAVAKSRGKIKVLELKRNLKETLDGARTTAEDLLQSHPNIQFVWGSNDTGAIGAGLAAKAAGKKLIITGMNGSPEAVAAVKKGLITATWDANQNAAGEVMVIHALQWLETGRKPPVTTNPFTRIDKSNASQYIPWPERAKVKR